MQSMEWAGRDPALLRSQALDIDLQNCGLPYFSPSRLSTITFTTALLSHVTFRKQAVSLTPSINGWIEP